jgi:hypothetical protein
VAKLVPIQRMTDGCSGSEKEELLKASRKGLGAFTKKEVIMNNIYIEDIDSNELLPKTLNNWNDPNLVATYKYCKSQKLKNLIECEFWYRSEKCLLNTLHS